jgi:predicted ester cyclase
MTREHIDALFDSRRSALNRPDATTLADFHAEAGVLESPSAGGTVSGRSAVERAYRAWFAAFPDFAIAGDELLVDGDRVVEIATVTGTDRGGFLGLHPTDRPLRLPVIILCTVKDGHILQKRRVYDFTGLLVQIDVLKAKPA